MSQRKRKTGMIVIALLFAFFGAIFLSANITLHNAKRASGMGRHQTAAAFYAQAAKIFFWQNHLWEQAGIESAQADDYESALNYFQRVENFSENGYVWLGTVYFQTGQFELASAAFGEALQKFPTANLYRLLAAAEREQKDWQAEKNALQNQIQLDAQDAYAHYRLGLLLMIFSAPDAFDVLSSASTLNPQSDSAIQTLIIALNIADTQSGAADKKVTIGRAFGLVQEWQLAMFVFQQAIEADEKNAEAWAWLGEAKQQAGQDGSVELNQAIKLNKNNVQVLALSALYWKRAGNYQEMLTAYARAAQIEPENPYWQIGLGEAYTKLGDLVSALSAYQLAVDLAPNDAMYWRALALFCAENNIYVQEFALPAVQQAIALAPQDEANADTLGYIYYLLGKYATAQQVFLDVIKTSPDYFPAHIHLALNYLAQGNRPAAYNSLTFVRDSDKTDLYSEVAVQLLSQYFP